MRELWRFYGSRAEKAGSFGKNARPGVSLVKIARGQGKRPGRAFWHVKNARPGDYADFLDFVGQLSIFGPIV